MLKFIFLKVYPIKCLLILDSIENSTDLSLI